MQLSQKIKQQKTPIIFFLCAMVLYLMLQGRAMLYAQDFAYDNKGNIVWETQGTGNPNPGYHYHTIGWKFTVTQKLKGITYMKTVTVYLGNAYSSSSAYARTGGITVTEDGDFHCTYCIPVSKLSSLTDLQLERGAVTITVDAVIEFYKRISGGSCTSSHISMTKADANNQCKTYSFRSNFDGTYTGYYGQTVTQKYFSLTVKKGTGVDKITINGDTLTAGKTMWYQKGKKITLEAIASKGYVEAGWSGDKQQNYGLLEFKMPAEGLEIKALAEPDVFPVRLDGNGGTVQRPASIQSDIVLEKYNTSWGYYPTSGLVEKYWTQEKPSTGFKAVRAGYTFQGFYNKKSGGTKIIDSAGKICCANTAFSDAVTIYAQWKANTDTPYTVRHWQQDIGGKGYKVKDTEKLKGTTGAKVTPAVKNYEGFARPAVITAAISGAGTTVVDYYYDRNMYKVASKCGSGIEKASVSSQSNTSEYEGGLRCWYGEKVTVKAQLKAGHKSVAWSGSFSAAGGTYTFSMPAKEISLEASAVPIQYRLSFDGNGADSGTMPYMILSYGTGENLYENRYGRNGYGFVGWSRQADGEAEFSDGQEVINLTDQDGAVILLYAVWQKNIDYSPVINAADRSFTLTQAKTGQITQEELFRTASVHDVEDGKIEPGVREENSFVIAGYEPDIFTSLCKDAIISITYRAQDSAGNEAETTVSIYVTDEEGNADPEGRSRFRFISSRYLDEDPENGGLSEDSIWRTGRYYDLLVKLLRGGK